MILTGIALMYLPTGRSMGMGYPSILTIPTNLHMIQHHQIFLTIIILSDPTEDISIFLRTGSIIVFLFTLVLLSRHFISG